MSLAYFYFYGLLLSFYLISFINSVWITIYVNLLIFTLFISIIIHPRFFLVVLLMITHTHALVHFFFNFWPFFTQELNLFYFLFSFDMCLLLITLIIFKFFVLLRSYSNRAHKTYIWSNVANIACLFSSNTGKRSKRACTCDFKFLGTFFSKK